MTCKQSLFSTTILALFQFITCASIPSHKVRKCSIDSFHFPSIHGAELLAIDASEVYNHTAFSLSPGTSGGEVYNVDFCNVTVTYSHLGWDDSIHVQVWLPLDDSWNGRLKALGGGGYSAGLGSLYLTQAVAQGYVAVDTDAGHESGYAAATGPPSWALTSGGNVNLHLLQDFSSTSLEEMAVIGKVITKNYFGVAPKFSYFTGCSQGGRQGLEIAQRYPDSYDGILAVAPAINLETFLPAAYWAHQVMNTVDYYPPPCEIQAFTDAAVQACDGLDGVEDGIISLPHLCHFKAHSIVGHGFSCDGSTRTFTREAADIVHAAWTGPRSPSGDIGWYGLNKDASLVSTYIMIECDSNNSNCRPARSGLIAGWFQYILAKDPTFDPTSMTTEVFFEYLQQSHIEYQSIFSSSNPNLTDFRIAGGKIISWHGLADEVIPPQGSATYYDSVLRIDPKAGEFYKYFEAPGVGHCIGGVGGIPNDAFEKLVAWVEDGIMPETLLATTNGDDSSSGGNGTTRPLCPYPMIQSYIGGDPGLHESFECVKKMDEDNDERVSDSDSFHSPHHPHQVPIYP